MIENIVRILATSCVIIILFFNIIKCNISNDQKLIKQKELETEQLKIKEYYDCVKITKEPILCG